MATWAIFRTQEGMVELQNTNAWNLARQYHTCCFSQFSQDMKNCALQDDATALWKGEICQLAIVPGYEMYGMTLYSSCQLLKVFVKKIAVHHATDATVATECLDRADKGAAVYDLAVCALSCRSSAAWAFSMPTSVMKLHKPWILARRLMFGASLMLEQPLRRSCRLSIVMHTCTWSMTRLFVSSMCC